MSLLFWAAYFDCPDVEAERIKIYNQYTETYKENSLAQKRPDLLEEWEKKKNGSLQPEQVTVGSDIKVWWKCSICGNVWQATIYNRVKGSGCPACAAQKASQRRKYDQQSIERVLSEISPEIEVVGKYLNITTKVRCRCKICGHEWEPLPSNLLKGSGCPKCKARETKLAELLREYPWLREEIVKVNEKFSMLNSPLGKVMEKKATIA